MSLQNFVPTVEWGYFSGIFAIAHDGNRLAQPRQFFIPG